MAETDKDVVDGEGREPGFYWVRDTFTPFPVVARWVQPPEWKHGCWAWPGIGHAYGDWEITVLSPRLEPPK